MRGFYFMLYFDHSSPGADLALGPSRGVPGNFGEYILQYSPTKVGGFIGAYFFSKLRGVGFLTDTPSSLAIVPAADGEAPAILLASGYCREPRFRATPGGFYRYFKPQPN